MEQTKGETVFSSVFLGDVDSIFISYLAYITAGSEDCPKCKKPKDLTKHHVFPKRYFGNGNKNNSTIQLCRDCHNELELLIPLEQKPKKFYLTLTWAWLTNSLVPADRNFQ